MNIGWILFAFIAGFGAGFIVACFFPVHARMKAEAAERQWRAEREREAIIAQSVNNLRQLIAEIPAKTGIATPTEAPQD